MLTSVGRRYPVDASGTRIFSYVDGRATPRSADISHVVWGAVRRKQRAKCLQRRAAVFADAPNAADGRPGSSSDPIPPNAAIRTATHLLAKCA